MRNDRSYAIATAAVHRFRCQGACKCMKRLWQLASGPDDPFEIPHETRRPARQVLRPGRRHQ